MLAEWLAHWPLVLEVMGSIPTAGEEKFGCKQAPLRFIYRDDMSTVRRPLDQDTIN